MYNGPNFRMPLSDLVLRPPDAVTIRLEGFRIDGASMLVRSGPSGLDAEQFFVAVPEDEAPEDGADA